MMAFREDGAEDGDGELTTRLLDGEYEHAGAPADGEAKVTVGPSHARDPGEDEDGYELVSDRETLVFDDDARKFRAKTRRRGDCGLLLSLLMDKIQPGSVKGSMFTMTVSIVGAGILALPYAVEQAGLLLGLLLIIGGALITNFSLRVLLASAELGQARSYMDLAYITGGRRLAGFTQLIMCLSLFGSAVGYLVGSAELLQLAMKTFLGEASDSIFVDKQWLMLVLVVCFVLPLSLFRSLSSLRFTSLFSIVCIVFMTFAIVAKYFQFVHLGWADPIWYQLQHLTLFNWNVHRLLRALPLVIFVYTCHPNVLPIYLVLQRRSGRRMHKVMNRSIAISGTVYALCSAFVVLTFGEATKSNFLNNDYHGDQVILLGVLGFGISLILTVPLFIHTMRDNIREAFMQNQRLGFVAHVSVTVMLVLCVWGIAEVAGGIASVLSLLGATTNPVICFMLPAYFVRRVGPSAMLSQQRWSLALAIIMTIISIASVLQLTHILPH